MTGSEMAKQLRQVADACEAQHSDGLRLGERMLAAMQKDVTGVVDAAHLVATAFRLRDEDGLVIALYRLTEAVSALEDSERNEASS